MIYTTYFSKLKYLPYNIAPISISRFPPKGVNILEYKTLAPSPELLRSYKATGDWAAYVSTYDNSILSKLNPHQVVNDLLNLAKTADIALVCFEKDYLHCHRHLVAEWLYSYGYDITEYGVPMRPRETNEHDRKLIEQEEGRQLYIADHLDSLEDSGPWF